MRVIILFATLLLGACASYGPGGYAYGYNSVYGYDPGTVPTQANCPYGYPVYDVGQRRCISPREASLRHPYAVSHTANRYRGPQGYPAYMVRRNSPPHGSRRYDSPGFIDTRNEYRGPSANDSPGRIDTRLGYEGPSARDNRSRIDTRNEYRGPSSNDSPGRIDTRLGYNGPSSRDSRDRIDTSLGYEYGSRDRARRSRYGD